MAKKDLIRGNIARTVSVVFTTPGQFKKAELPDWLEIKPTKYQLKNIRNNVFHPLDSSAKLLILNELDREGLTIVRASCREKISRRGTQTQTNFTLSNSEVSRIPESNKDEAVQVFDCLFRYGWRRVSALSRDEHSPLSAILLS